MTTLRALGLMSGTSMDGIDLAVIETDGETVSSFGASGYQPYSDADRTLLKQALADAVGLNDRSARPGALADAERMITARHIAAVQDFLARERIDPGSLDLVGFHGQTVLHRPADRLTVQIGDGAALAQAIGIPVVFDMRAADVAAGGQGAPLVPVFHRALAKAVNDSTPVCVVNIGGVSNITYIDGETLIACDTGPGNALLDDFMLKATGDACDRDGRAAAQGAVDQAWLANALALPFFKQPPPKSLDRNAFAGLPTPSGSTENVAATLTMFTAAAIGQIVPLLPKVPGRWIVAGGGANNPTMMRMLGECLAPAIVETAQSRGWKGDAVEAQAFAFLAVRSRNGLPLTYPATTGVASSCRGGVLIHP